MATYTHDVDISAVPYDAILVAELVARMTPKLRAAPYWPGGATVETMAIVEPSRLVVVLHQRLWGRDVITSRDESTLKARAESDPRSVLVVTLDDAALPEWLLVAQRCDFTATGLDGTAAFVLAAVTELGGELQEVTVTPATTHPVGLSHSAPPSFLAQPRAQATLRKELDGLAADLRSRLKTEEALDAARIVEFHSLPNRLVARVDGVGLSFSWINAGLGSVALGRLLVIQWDALDKEVRGIRALRPAVPVRERSYYAEGGDAASWCWRADDPNGRASSTANLAAEWFAGASLSVTPSAA
jgi:hypothetical protein